MREGRRVYDADTHVQPTAEALEPYLSARVRELVPDLDEKKSPIRIGLAGEERKEPYRHMYRFGGGEGGWGGSAVRVLGDAGPARRRDAPFSEVHGFALPHRGWRRGRRHPRPRYG